MNMPTSSTPSPVFPLRTHHIRDLTTAQAISALLLLSLLTASLRLLATRYLTPLRRIPGPFLASVSQLDRLRTAASGKQYEDHLAYHRQYGPLVRLGPRHVSIGFSPPPSSSTPTAVAKVDLNAAITTIYGVPTNYLKSDFYALFDVKDPRGPVFPTVFSVRDDALHKQIKRRVHGAYTTASMRTWEGKVDACVRIFLDKMAARFADRESGGFDLGSWLHWFAFDVVSDVSYSERLGFMEQEEDVGGIIAAIERRLMYNSTVGQAPGLHRWLLGNAVSAALLPRCLPGVFGRVNAAAYVVKFAGERLRKYRERKGELGAEEGGEQHGAEDMLARFKRYREDGREVMSDVELLSHAASNIFAGSDTTATTLRSIVFNLCRYPECYGKLMEEVDGVYAGRESDDCITFDEAAGMVYLQACIKEALRIHPVVGQLLERIVPEGGMQVGGVLLPKGTVVGVSPWVAARDPEVYGKDCEVFRPERWIEADAETLKRMERHNLAVRYDPTYIFAQG